MSETRGWKTRAIFLDITKSYDQSNTLILVNDLVYRYNLPRFLGRWIKSWISDRSIAARARSIFSRLQHSVPNYIDDIPSMNKTYPSWTTAA
jgi:hypothetical protein